MKEKLNQYHIAILIYMTQSGIVIFSLPRLVAENFGTNGWYVLVIISLLVTCNIFLMQLVYRFGKGSSVFDILEQRIPLAVLSPIYILLALFWAYLGCLVGKQYILILQMLAFPTTNPMVFKFIFDFMALILISKQIYNITKAATVFFYLTIWMVFVFFFHFPEFSWLRLTPFIGYGGIGGLESWLEIYIAFLGYEVCLFLIPYVPEKTKVFKAVYIGNFFLTFIYLFICVIGFGFFSFGQLTNLVYPLLDMLAYLQLPFIERIENFLFTLFLFKVLMTTVIYFWIAKITLSRVFRKVKSTWLDLSVVVVSYGLSLIPQVISEVERLLRMLGYTQIVIVYVFPLLLLAVIALNRMSNRRRENPS